MPSVYLAGPEVFLAGGRELIDLKRDLAARHGLEPTRRHAEFTPEELHGPLGLAISRRNEQLMDEADLCIANLTPFRGLSADPGTVFEVGYVIAQGKPVFGYTTEPALYADRVATALGPLTRNGGRLEAADGSMVEDHGWSDNLMMEGAILSRGWDFVRAPTAPADPWRDLDTFEECVRRAAAYARG
jgi:nucleoside 2-deoxyribosyltransferase